VISKTRAAKNETNAVDVDVVDLVNMITSPPQFQGIIWRLGWRISAQREGVEADRKEAGGKCG
jgi:hypothetical protein